MTDEEMAQLLIEWATAKGGEFTDYQLDGLIAILEEHFPEGPRSTTLEQARTLLGIRKDK